MTQGRQLQCQMLCTVLRGCIRYLHGHVDPCKTDVAKRVHQAAIRHLACPRQRKTTLSKKVLKKLGKLLTTGKLADLQTLTLITLGFGGCLQWNDLSHICVDGLSF